MTQERSDITAWLYRALMSMATLLIAVLSWAATTNLSEVKSSLHEQNVVVNKIQMDVITINTRFEDVQRRIEQLERQQRR